jgi:uncharacterized repeat protein (TIGR03803 family)
MLMAALIVSVMLAPGASAQGYQTLHAFTGGSDGNDYMWVTGQSNWYSSGLVLDSSGNLYGVAAGGGAFGNGVVYELSQNSDASWTETVLYNFTGGADGGFPFGGLIFDGVGALYGTTSGGGSGKCSNRYTTGCGVVFKLTANGDGSWTQTVLHSFAGTGDGAQPEARLTFDTAGNLYGSTVTGGLNRCTAFNNGFDNGCPLIFKLTPNADGSWTETVIHRFTGLNDGGGEPSPLLFDAAGNLYGTTSNGGISGVGVAFKLTPSSNGTWTESILHSFPSTNTGFWVMTHTGLVFDSAGNLYGTSFWLPNFGGGTVFKLTPTSSGPWKLTYVHGFGTANQYHPVGGVIFDEAGNLYGTAITGGTDGDGVVFKLAPNGIHWTYSVLYNFDNAPLSAPFSLIRDSAGNLYGTANYSATASGGVFEITP